MQRECHKTLNTPFVVGEEERGGLHDIDGKARLFYIPTIIENFKDPLIKCISPRKYVPCMSPVFW